MKHQNIGVLHLQLILSTFQFFLLIKTLLSKNKADLQGHYINYKSYWKMRENQSRTMQEAVKEMETSWLREWRILFIADPVTSDSTQEVHDTIDKLISNNLKKTKLSPKENWLLKKIASCSFCLNKNEIAKAVKYVVKNDTKLANNIILSIQGLLGVSERIKHEKRKPLILIVDEYIDYLPFEAMDILKTQPVTRFGCVQVAYALFREHKDTMKNGYKIIEMNEEVGSFIVNPENNLGKMSKRLKLFIDYWLPKWNGVFDRKPNNNEFTDALVNHDILMYSGHGSGIQFLAGEQIERLRVKSLELLFGCSSVKLFTVGGDFPPFGISNQYLTACSPCVLGTLWEVTDCDVDRVTVTFISRWIPSKAPRPWSDYDLNQWINGELTLKNPLDSNKSKKEDQEPDMLKAIACAKQNCNQFMTSSAIIVRGLPVKLKY